MLLSMTGFGKSNVSLDELNVTVEVRTLNSRFLDLGFKMPGTLREKEMELRTLISKRLVRGKAEVMIEIDEGAKQQTLVNKAMFSAYCKELRELSAENNLNEEGLLAIVLKIPEVIQPAKNVLNENQWTVIWNAIREALDQLVKFRENEGAKLHMDLEYRVTSIRSYLEKVKEIDPKRQQAVGKRMMEKIGELKDADAIGEGRFEQELVYYIEKLDITEEITRLEAHCQHFSSTMIDDGADAKGKKLSFIGQEMGREINTIGSKANDADLQKVVVEMKEQLEQIKEQVNNIL